MPVTPSLASVLDPFVDTHRLLELVSCGSVDVQESFTTYVAEALHFRRVLEPNIRALKSGSRVVEIGSGIGLLARLIAAEGHSVAAFEPETAGFSRMHAISEMLEECWRAEHRDVSFVRSEFTEGSVDSRGASLIVAVNVIEHVPAPDKLIIAATRSLTPTGTARFICPNYAFPYEPHFNVPTVINKQVTYRLARRVIEHSRISEPEQFWLDLSWPTVRTLRHSLGTAGIRHSFSRAALFAYVDRLDEPSFLERKGMNFRRLARVARPIIGTVARYVPIVVAPIIDLTTSPM